MYMGRTTQGACLPFPSRPPPSPTLVSFLNLDGTLPPILSIFFAHSLWATPRWPVTTFAPRFTISSNDRAGAMRDTYWNADLQQNYTIIDNGAEVVVSQHFQSDGQLAGILVCSFTPKVDSSLNAETRQSQLLR